MNKHALPVLLLLASSSKAAVAVPKVGIVVAPATVIAPASVRPEFAAALKAAPAFLNAPALALTTPISLLPRPVIVRPAALKAAVAVKAEALKPTPGSELFDGAASRSGDVPAPPVAAAKSPAPSRGPEHVSMWSVLDSFRTAGLFEPLEIAGRYKLVLKLRDDQMVADYLPEGFGDGAHLWLENGVELIPGQETGAKTPFGPVVGTTERRVMGLASIGGPGLDGVLSSLHTWRPKASRSEFTGVVHHPGETYASFDPTENKITCRVPSRDYVLCLVQTRVTDGPRRGSERQMYYGFSLIQEAK